MRLCIITANINKIISGEKELKEIIGQFMDPASVNEIYVTGYDWPEKDAKHIKAYPLFSRDTFKVKSSCFVLKRIDELKWMPVSLAVLAIKFMREEIVNSIANIDPDVIITSGFRWQKELDDFIMNVYGGNADIAGRNKSGAMYQIKRSYDPSIKISIVLPTYNGSKYIRTSIESCLNQTHKNIELIIVDDASIDTTPEIISSYTDKRIRYVRNKENMKLPRTLNVGFAHANGEFLTWTSDDNYYEPDAIKTMLSVLCTYSQFEFVYAGQYAIDENDSILRHDHVRPIRSLKVSNPVGGCFLYTRKVAETIGKYNPDAFLAEDLDYWIRVSRHFHMVSLRRPLYYYRYHKDSLTSKYALGEVSKVAGSIRKNHNLFTVK